MLVFLQKNFEIGHKNTVNICTISSQRYPLLLVIGLRGKQPSVLSCTSHSCINASHVLVINSKCNIIQAKPHLLYAQG